MQINVSRLHLRLSRNRHEKGGCLLKEINLKKNRFDTLKKFSIPFVVSEIKGPAASIEDAGIMGDTDMVLSPVLSTLDDSFELFSQSAEKTVLKRILKALWKLLLNTIEKELVLPPTTGNTLLNAGKSAMELGKKFGSTLKTTALSGTLPAGITGAVQGSLLTAEKTLSPRHCAVMECAIENLKIYFHSDGMGLKKNFLAKSADLTSLQYALSLYTLSTGNC
jgi:protein unc-13